MTDAAFAPCNSCGRAILEEGPLFTLEAAWDKSSLQPAAVELLSLLSKPKFLEPLATLTDRLRRYCARGKLPIPEEMNHLVDNVWEFKGGTLRLVFYKAGEQCGRPTLRATHVFVKGTEKTPRKEIDRAVAIARVDATVD